MFLVMMKLFTNTMTTPNATLTHKYIESLSGIGILVSVAHFLPEIDTIVLRTLGRSFLIIRNSSIIVLITAYHFNTPVHNIVMKMNGFLQSQSQTKFVWMLKEMPYWLLM